MKIERDVSLVIHFLLDECLPPFVRDGRWFMWFPFRLLFGDKAGVLRRFKDEAHEMSDAEFRRVYEDTASVRIQRATDLNAACEAAIARDAIGPRVLEVGCGRGHLAGILSRRHDVTACDMVVPPELRAAYPHVSFAEDFVERLSFADAEFDTVVCTHTLEHVLDLGAAIRELRRVARRRLLIVVPRQRPYRHTFDLHLHFFPLRCSLLAWLRPSPRTGTRDLRVLGGDWYYREDLLEPGGVAGGSPRP